MEHKQLIEFRPASGGASFAIVMDGANDTVWVTQAQLVKLFGKSKGTISDHIRNIYSDGELEENTTVRNFRTVQIEGERSVQRSVRHYNLDVVISVGYRVNSKVGIEFRKWATKRLKEYLIRGYAVNRHRLEELRQSFQLVKSTVGLEDAQQDEREQIVEILADYALGLDILDGYDHQSLDVGDIVSTTSYRIDYDDAIAAIDKLKEQFGGSEWFGNEKDQSFRSSIAAIDQTFDGQPVYPTIEEKAANLLYFVVKNHSFTDGNKRIAAWLFVWYLNQNAYLMRQDGSRKVENNALAALTLMIALSKHDEKELMINIVMKSLTS